MRACRQPRLMQRRGKVSVRRQSCAHVGSHTGSRADSHAGSHVYGQVGVSRAPAPTRVVADGWKREMQGP